MEGTRIVLVRHGESRAQELGFLGGHDGCQGLSDRGRRQAVLLRDRLRSTGELADASVLYSSLMPRAVETAAIDALVARHPGETIVVACHGGVIVHSMLHFLSLGDGATDGRAWRSADNTSLTEWRFAPNPYQKGTLPVELVRFNDVAHRSDRSLR